MPPCLQVRRNFLSSIFTVPSLLQRRGSQPIDRDSGKDMLAFWCTQLAPEACYYVLYANERHLQLVQRPEAKAPPTYYFKPRTNSMQPASDLDARNDLIHGPLLKHILLIASRSLGATAHLTLLSLTLTNLRRETGLDRGDTPSTTARVAGHEVKTVLSLIQFSVWRSAGLACYVFD